MTRGERRDHGCGFLRFGQLWLRFQAGCNGFVIVQEPKGFMEEDQGKAKESGGVKDHLVNAATRQRWLEQLSKPAGSK